MGNCHLVYGNGMVSNHTFLSFQAKDTSPLVVTAVIVNVLQYLDVKEKVGVFHHWCSLHEKYVHDVQHLIQ
jgi:hypothetical protein